MVGLCCVLSSRFLEGEKKGHEPTIHSVAFASVLFLSMKWDGRRNEKEWKGRKGRKTNVMKNEWNACFCFFSLSSSHLILAYIPSLASLVHPFH